MKLEVTCSWNEKQDSGVLAIRFDHMPHSLFSMPEKEIYLLQELLQKAPYDGPIGIKELQSLHNKYPESLYIGFNLYRVLEFFEYFEERDDLLKVLQKNFSNELLVTSLLASRCLNDKQYQKFVDIFENQEVLKALFPQRDLFYFEEVLFFHSLWISYFKSKGDGFQKNEHQKLASLIIKTHHTFYNLKGDLNF